jgi:hypothetical protein
MTFRSTSKMLLRTLASLATCLGSLKGIAALPSTPADSYNELIELAPRKDWLSPEYTWMFKYPLPIPPLKEPRV